MGQRSSRPPKAQVAKSASLQVAGGCTATTSMAAVERYFSQTHWEIHLKLRMERNVQSAKHFKVPVCLLT